jgi:hypothetical protein
MTPPNTDMMAQEPAPGTGSESGREALIEALAAIEHQRWSDWQAYLHSKCAQGPVINRIGPNFGRHDLIIPAGYVAALERQVTTSYAELSEQEQQSDRDEVMRYWPLIVAFVAAWIEDDGAGGDAAVAQAARWIADATR